MILGRITDSNLPANSQVISSLFSAAIKNNIYISQKAIETAKENQTTLFTFIKFVLNKTKDVELIAEHVLRNKNFLYTLKVFKTSREFFDSIELTNAELPIDLSAFTNELSIILTMIIQLVNFESAKMFTEILKKNPRLQKVHELVLYRKTLWSNEGLLVSCMKITARFISEKRPIISTQLLIIQTIINSSLFQFSRNSCEQIINVFMGVLQNLKAANNEYNYFTCCSAFGHHICITIFLCSLKVLVFYLKADPTQQLSDNFKDNIDSIVDYFLQAIKIFECPSFENDVRSIYASFFEASRITTSESTAQFLILLFQDVFEEKKCQNVLYVAEEVRSFINLYSVINDETAKESAFLQELNALYVGHLLNGNNSKEKIREKIIKYYNGTNPTSTIVEVIDKNESYRKPKGFDIELLQREERNVCTKWFKHMIPKLIESSNNDLNYVLVALDDKDFTHYAKILEIYTQNLKELSQVGLDKEAKAEKYLTLACAAKVDVSWQTNLLKGKSYSL